MRDSERDALAKASTIALGVDERNGRLLWSYTACSEKGLDVTVGFLAQLIIPQGTALDVAQSVRHVVRRLCTKRKPHANMNQVRTKPMWAVAAEANILQRIEFITADGAANEQLALRLLHPKSCRATDVEKLPNLKLTLRDKAHATRRIAERTFKADPTLWRILDNLLFCEGSLAKQLRFSPAFSAIFNTEVQRQTRCSHVHKGVKNLSCARQRCDSTAKPLGRCLWHLDALINTCQIIRDTRGPTTPAGKICDAFLSALDEETIILLGMLADANDECLALTRFFDNSRFELGHMAAEVVAFKSRLEALFGPKQHCLSTGYTQISLQHVRHRRLLKVAKEETRQIGGLTPAAAMGPW